MRAMPLSGRARRAAFTRPIVALAPAAAVSWLVLTPAALGGTAVAASSAGVRRGVADGGGGVDVQSTPTSAKPIATATLTQCATATIPQTERSATFAGEMTAIAATARMQMRIDLEERTPGEQQYRMVNSPALGVWHGSTPGVKVFAHIQQVTNLSAPAVYRGVVRFRWINAKGHTIKAEELRTARCEQPAPPSSSGAGAPMATAGAIGAADTSS